MNGFRPLSQRARNRFREHDLRLVREGPVRGRPAVRARCRDEGCGWEDWFVLGEEIVDERPVDPRRPVVYLDVDGVLNAWTMRSYTPPKNSFPGFETVEVTVDGETYELTVSKAMGAALVDALAPADVFWVTTWKADAPALLGPMLGLPDWPWLNWRVRKAEAVITDQLSEPRPFVWIDDDEFVGRRGEWAMQQLAKELGDVDEPLPPHLLVAPSPRTGLRPSEVERIGEWLRRPR